jgi:hypothetical protein
VQALAITALDVAFASAVAAGLAAVTAPLSAWFIASGSWFHERTLAHAGRMFEARRDLYVRAVTDAHRYVRLGTDQIEALRTGKLTSSNSLQPPTAEVRTRQRGLLGALGSDDMVKAVDDFHAALAEFITTLGGAVGRATPAGHLVGTDEEVASVLRAWDEMDRARMLVGMVARHDLTSPPKQRRARWKGRKRRAPPVPADPSD